MNSQVDQFLGKAKQWQKEMVQLRGILLETALVEDFKWRLPCYTTGENNIAIMQPFKGCLGLMFFKGSLLKDPKKVLISNAPNSQAGRRFEFRSTQDITKLIATIKAYVKEAIAIEKSGLKVEFKAQPQAMPAELKSTLARKPQLNKAFKALTPGRQRAYILHFSSAKQSATRQSRIEKAIPRILAGKGPNDP